MSNLWEDFKTAMTAGGSVGGFVGIVVFIWAEIAHIQPALVESAGFSKVAADFITLAIALGGGLEVSLGLGGVLGVLHAAVLFALIYFPIVFIQKGCAVTHTVVEGSATKLKQLAIDSPNTKENEQEITNEGSDIDIESGRLPKCKERSHETAQGEGRSRHLKYPPSMGGDRLNIKDNEQEITHEDPAIDTEFGRSPKYKEHSHKTDRRERKTRHLKHFPPIEDIKEKNKMGVIEVEVSGKGKEKVEASGSSNHP